jgi:hypothetical protein
MKDKGLAAVIAIIVVASLGIGYLSGTSIRATETVTSVRTSTVTSTTTSISTETLSPTHGILVPTSLASSLNPLTGLSLNLNLSTNANGQLVLTAYEFNTLDRINNVSYGSSWPNASLWQWTEYDCSEGSMMGYEILQGNYAPNNYTQGMALWIHTMFLAQGGCGVAPDNASYSFKPLSVRSLISGTYAGFWSGPFNDSGYETFAAGTYTVLAGDQWGQVAILRFIVAG